MIRVLHKHPSFRVSHMGNSLVVNFHGRFSQLFEPLVWSETDWCSVDLMVSEATKLVTGMYGRLSTLAAQRQVQSIPSSW